MYKFLENNYLKHLFYNGFINTKGNNDYTLYSLLTKSYQKDDNYFIHRKKLEAFLNFDNDTDITFSNWYYVKSKSFVGEKKHRIYLHPKVMYIPLIAKKFVEKCKIKNIQFWFKFKFSQDADGMVFYPTDEQLPIFYQILKEIMKENPIIEQTCMEVPISTIKFDKHFGYGLEKGDGKSWTENIANTIKLSFKHVLCKTISNVDFLYYSIDYLTEKFVEAYIIDYKDYLEENDKYNESIEFEKNKYILINKFKPIIGKLIKVVKNHNKYRDYIENNSIICKFYINGEKFIIRPSLIVEFAKFFINDIVKKYGEDKILDIIKNYTMCNLDNAQMNVNIPIYLKKCIN